jgi:2-alkenal reductase
LGFAIPSNTARAVSEQIIQNGFFARPYLGIRWQPISPDLAAVYNLPVPWGAYVTRVVPGSPAQDAGMQNGDIITRIGDADINQDRSFANALFRYQPGDRVELEIIRDGQQLLVQIVLGQTTSP